jgi:tetratricopeptide (TPR) repeat protein
VLRPSATTRRADKTGLPRGSRPLFRLRSRVLALSLALGLLLILPTPNYASRASSRVGVPGTRQVENGSMLVEYYEAFLRDRDVEAFRRNVSARYSEAALGRLLQASELQARRASVLALGLFGGFGINSALARGLKDPDPAVRALADEALWAIWYRADSAENNQALELVRTDVGRGRLDRAVEQAGRLIAKAPTFAEAYNQRAIAYFFMGRFAESAEDCRSVLIHNPYHIGALGGLGQCQLRLGLREDAIRTFRRSLKLQPYNQGLRQSIAELEAGE